MKCCLILEPADWAFRLRCTALVEPLAVRVALGTLNGITRCDEQ